MRTLFYRAVLVLIALPALANSSAPGCPPGPSCDTCCQQKMISCYRYCCTEGAVGDSGLCGLAALGCRNACQPSSNQPLTVEPFPDDGQCAAILAQ